MLEAGLLTTPLATPSQFGFMLTDTRSAVIAPLLVHLVVVGVVDLRKPDRYEIVKHLRQKLPCCPTRAHTATTTQDLARIVALLRHLGCTISSRFGQHRHFELAARADPSLTADEVDPYRLDGGSTRSCRQAEL